MLEFSYLFLLFCIFGLLCLPIVTTWLSTALSRIVGNPVLERWLVAIPWIITGPLSSKYLACLVLSWIVISSWITIWSCHFQAAEVIQKYVHWSFVMPLSQFLIYSPISYLNDQFISKIKRFCKHRIKPLLLWFLLL